MHCSNGEDMVVGVTDTGLYIDHDQFRQSERDIYGEIRPNARKVIYYNPFGDRFDQSEKVTCGHGTHVAGSLVPLVSLL